MTSVFVNGRDYLRDSGITASLGAKAFGFAWGSVGCLLIASLGFCCVACLPGRSRDHPGSRTGRYWRGRNRPVKPDVPATY